jgi:hypothetical protein
MTLYLGKWEDNTAALVTAEDEEHLFDVLDQLEDPNAASWVEYDAPLWLKFNRVDAGIPDGEWPRGPDPGCVPSEPRPIGLTSSSRPSAACFIQGTRRPARLLWTRSVSSRGPTFDRAVEADLV